MARLTQVIVSFILLLGIAFAVDAPACGSILSANTAYILNQSFTANGTNCYNVTGANVSINCNGYSITGNNTYDTYGIYTTKLNTTIKNCIISQFWAGIFYNGDNGSITNCSVSNTYPDVSSAAIYLYESDGNSVTNSFANNTVGTGMLVYNSDRNRVNNVNATSTTGSASLVYGDYNNITNSNFSSSAGIGFKIYYGVNNTVANNKVSGVDATYGAFFVYYEVKNSTFANNTINGGAAALGMYFFASGPGNLIINNTISNATALVELNDESSGNTFYWNNFSNAGSYYVNDLNGSNFYNSTEGNIYPNVMDGSVQIVGLVNSTISPNLLIGTNGSGYPYGHSTSDSKFSCDFIGCADYAPLTPYLMELGNISVTCGTGGTCTGNATDFIIPANKSITASPISNYVFSNWSVVSGSCTIGNSTNSSTTVEVTAGECVVQSTFTAIPVTTSSTNIILALIAIVVAIVFIILILRMTVSIESLIAVMVIAIIVIQMIIPYLLSN